MMKKTLLTMAVAACMATGAQAQLVYMTGIVDGNLSGGNPKGIELFVQGTINLSGYSIFKSSNGGSFSSVMSLSGTYTDEFVYLSNSATNFSNVFGSSGDFSNLLIDSDINGNGNDGFQLILNAGSLVVDQIYEANNSDIYADSYLYRVSGTGPDGGWVAGNWDIPGNDTLDGATTTSAVAAAVPFGTFTAVPEPHEYALGIAALVVLVAFARRRRMSA